MMYKIENLLRETMGLDPASIGSSLIERTVRLRMKSRRLKKLEDYRQLLATSPTEMNELIESVVVTETWFFRDREPFAALVRLVMNEWLPSHPFGVLRLLSIPCASGEEPYSIAMALLDAGLPTDRFQIDAIDISARALARAERGVYGKNSFRTPDLDFRNRYFQPVKEGYLLSESVHRRVFFQSGNLLDDKCLTEKGIYDFIFCRNLLIYFDAPTQTKVLQKLDRLLTPTGLCFVGPAELPLVTSNGFVSANIPMAFASRKADTIPFPHPERRPRQPKTLKALGRQPVTSWPALLPRHQPPAKPEPEPQLLNHEAAAPKKLEAAQRLADEGKLVEAADLCEAHLREHGPSDQAYYLLGLVRDAAGETGQAITCYQKAIYLEPNHYEALLQLALLAEKEGDGDAARRLRQRAQRVRKQN
jgi:chemotaxis protein methyltransferase WspC